MFEFLDVENEKGLKLKNEPLIKQTQDILLPPLHIKLGIASKFVKTAVESSPEVFDCLKTIFPKLSDAKIRAGNHVIFIIFFSLFADFCLSIFLNEIGVMTGPDIRKLMKRNEFAPVLTNDHRSAWDALKDVIQNVLGKN